jgi:ATP-dependent Lon protease
MSFKGEWILCENYKKGDIVFIPIHEHRNSLQKQIGINYFTCVLNHTSCELVYPSNPEEIYWCKINNDFLEIIHEISNQVPSLINKSQLPLISPSPTSQLIPRQLKIITQSQIKSSQKKKNIKRKIMNCEYELEEYKKKKTINSDIELSLGEKLLLLDVDLETKEFLIDKYNNIKKNSSDSAKGITWINTVLSLPFNKYKPFPIKANSAKADINKFFSNVRAKLDQKVYGLDYVKEEIMEYLARKITNPKAKGHVLALHGSAGTGKSKIISALGEALNLPFHQINMGGLNDVSILTGHSETYVSAKPGKIVELLSNSGYMNGIIYLDEIDKISGSHKQQEINGILTHMLDEDQNHKFQDNYLSNVNIDLSKIFFVIAFNDISKIDPIVLDRMKIFKIKNPTDNEKLIIAKDKIIPELNPNFKVNDELLLYIIKEKVQKEDGVRQLKKCLEKLINRINYQVLIGKMTDIKDVTKKFIDDTIENTTENNTSYKMMYL